jgi:aspartate carbamoyltransferase catalytic subunit
MGRDIRDALTEAEVPFRDETDLASVLPDVDVVYQTRVQKERFEREDDYQAVKGTYVLDQRMYERLNPKAIVLHPLPRVDEIATEVDADPRSAYFRQARNGVFIRMALLDYVLT